MFLKEYDEVSTATGVILLTEVVVCCKKKLYRSFPFLKESDREIENVWMDLNLFSCVNLIILIILKFNLNCDSRYRQQ